MKAFFKTVLAVLSNVAALLFSGFTLSMLWWWFVMPVFHELPEIGVFAGAGLVLVAKFLTTNIQPFTVELDARTEDVFFKRQLIMWCKPVVFLWFGYLLHLIY